jgi:hypothetical protein
MSSSGVERLERGALLLHRSAVAHRQVLIGIEDDPPVPDGPGAGDPPVDQVRADREGVPRREDAGSIRSRKDAGPARVHEQQGVPVREEPNRSGRLRVREGRVRQIDQLAAVLVTLASKAQRSPTPLGVGR